MGNSEPIQDNGVEHKFALLLDSYDGKLSDAWSHLCEQYSIEIESYDHDDDFLIFPTAHESRAAQVILEDYIQKPLEPLILLLLPVTTDKRKEFTDYGFISHSGLPYVYAESVFLFSIHSNEADAQPYQAFEQMDEHLLASFSKNTISIFVTDNHSDELMHRIARAYRCSVIPLPIQGMTDAH